MPKDSKIPIYKPRKRTRTRDPQKKLSDVVNYKTAPPKKSKKPRRPSEDKEISPGRNPEVKYKQGLAKGLASLAKVVPSGGYTGIIKGGLAGAAAGAEIEAAYKQYKVDRAKGKKAKTTVSRSAAAQKAQYHKKDKTSTEKH